MPSATFQSFSLTSPPPPSRFPSSSNFIDHNPLRIRFKRRIGNFRTLECARGTQKSPSFSVSCAAVAEPSAAGVCSSVDHRLRSLVSEFGSLPEATDRVRRLLRYAALLPPLEESARVEHNEVRGCTAQVWVETSMDEGGLMRFRADSDSEITKGFCSCLIWLLDGAAPEEVLGMKTEDLGEMNVGLPGRAHSRVNTWHIVLISMQKRTRALVAERERRPPSEALLLSGCCR